MAERVERRTADLTSALIDIHDEDPEAFTLEEIASILFSLSFAGHETTNYLIGNLVRRLLEDPARWARVVADPAAIPGAVEETLRFDPSVCVWRRVTTKPASVGGVELPAGRQALPLAGRRRPRRLGRSPSPTPSTSTATTPAATSPSAAVSTTAWARASASSRPSWRWRSWRAASRGWRSWRARS